MSQLTSRGLSAKPGASRVVRRWRNAVFVIFAACGFIAASIAARIPTISLELHLDTAQVGLLLFAIAVGSISGLLAAGHIVANFGAQRTIRFVFVLGAVGIATASFGIALVGSFALSFVGLVVFGGCYGICDVAMNLSGAANERALGKSIMPVYHGFFSLGTIAGAGIGTIAEDLHVPLEVHITVVIVFLTVAVLVATRFLQRETPEPGAEDAHPVSTWRKRLAIWKEPRTILIGLIVLGMAFTEGSSNDWLSYAMVHGHATSRTVGALVYSVFVCAMTLGRLTGVRFLDRFGRVVVLRSTAVLAVVGLLLFIFVPVFWVDIVGVVFWGLGASLGFPVGMSAAADDPHTAAARLSAVSTIGYTAFLVGPPVLGFLGSQFGILHALLLVLVLAAMAGVASAAARPRGPAAPAAGEAS